MDSRDLGDNRHPISFADAKFDGGFDLAHFTRFTGDMQRYYGLYVWILFRSNTVN